MCFLMQVASYDVRSGRPSALSPLIGPLVQTGTNSTDSFFPTIDVTVNKQLVVTALGRYWVMEARSLSILAASNHTGRVDELLNLFILLASPDRLGHSESYIVAVSTDESGSAVNVVTQSQS